MFNLFFNLANFYYVILPGGVISLICYRKYKKTHSRALLNCLPGVFTSLGLLGTFVSICLSLGGIQDVTPELIDHTGKTLAEVNAAGTQDLDITKIIKELIPAFTTSIAGLILALIATVGAKWIFANEEAKEDETLKNKRPEEYIQEIAFQSSEIKEKLVALIQLHREQEEKNRVYNDKLNNNISNQSTILKEFIDGFVNRMDGIFKQMQGAIQQQVHNFGEEQFTKTSLLLSSITERLSNVSVDIINNQRQSVENMMSNTNEELKNITTSVSTVLGKLSGDIQTSLSLMGTEQTNRLNSIISSYDSLATRLSEQNSEFATKVTAQMQAEYEKLQNHNVESLQQMIDLKDAYQETTSNILNSTLEMNQQATKDVREAISGFVTDLQTSITDQCNSLSVAITSNVESLNQAYHFIESLVAEIRQNYDQAVLSYGDAVNVAHRCNESSKKVIASTNNSLKNVEETNKSVAKVLDILVERQDNIEQLTKQICHISATIIELQKLEKTLNKITSSK